MEKKTKVKAPAKKPETMTREELAARYKANVAERKRLSEENKYLGRLWKNAKKKPEQAVKGKKK